MNDNGHMSESARQHKHDRIFTYAAQPKLKLLHITNTKRRLDPNLRRIVIILRLVQVHTILLHTHRLHALIRETIAEPPPFQTVNAAKPRRRRGRKQARRSEPSAAVPRDALNADGRGPRAAASFRPLSHLARLEAVQHAVPAYGAAVVQLVHAVHEKRLFFMGQMLGLAEWTRWWTHHVASASRCAQAVRCIARAISGADGQLRVVIRRAYVLHLVQCTSALQERVAYPDRSAGIHKRVSPPERAW